MQAALYPKVSTVLGPLNKILRIVDSYSIIGARSQNDLWETGRKTRAANLTVGGSDNKHMSKKLFALVMVTGILGGVLAGCGSSETPAETTTGTTAAAPATTGDAAK